MEKSTQTPFHLWISVEFMGITFIKTSTFAQKGTFLGEKTTTLHTNLWISMGFYRQSEVTSVDNCGFSVGNPADIG